MILYSSAPRRGVERPDTDTVHLGVGGIESKLGGQTIALRDSRLCRT